MENTENKKVRYKVLIPPKASPLVAIGAVLLAVFIYLLAVPFDIAFVSGGTEVYRQESVGVLNNIEDHALSDSGSSGWKKVYGEKKLNFAAQDGDKEILFADNYGEVKKLMMRKAIVNLFTFAWSEEDFTIEFNAK